MMKKASLLVALLLFFFQAKAQVTFTLEEAVSYALKNHPEVKNGIADRQDAELQIDEIKQSGLPQINGSFSYSANLIIPKTVVAANTFDPTAPEGLLIPLEFGVPWGGQAAIGLNQLVFDAQWLVGLRAADTYRQLADQGLVQTKVTLSENVQKAYYSVLVSQERTEIINLNISRLDSVIYNTQKLFEQGFVEKLDIDRLTVQRNNLITEKQKVQNLIRLSKNLLKFQMSFDMKSEILLTDKLDDINIDLLTSTSRLDVNPDDRIEYNLLQTQRKLTELNIERYQKGYLPSVSFSGNLGANHGNRGFNPFENWFALSSLSLGVNIPIFDSGLKRTQIERERISLVKVDNGAEIMKSSFELENQQALVNLTNGLETLEIQKRNLALAEEVVRVSQIKYKEGVGSNLEIINAENDLKQSQTNYLASVYDVLVAKVDLDKAHGKLLLTE